MGYESQKLIFLPDEAEQSGFTLELEKLNPIVFVGEWTVILTP
jgi:hypothetical protein